ncbi:MAG: hypothetical protein KDD43_09525 [Bdellovibrionales bacterium]|nr:hypothetical protein [Bdellovibrionales bacterium]
MGKLTQKKQLLLKERSELLNGSPRAIADTPGRERSRKLLSIEKQLARLESKKKI